jgi:lactate dehydrogenase-like 2-hydroxyacid dehydrogenase
MGRIGQAVAKRARAFDMTIHYHGRSRLAPEQEQGAMFHANLDDMLPHCDFLSVHCASTPETRGLINERTIARLPDGAIIVNTARGDIVDDEALISALQSGKLAAAGPRCVPRRAQHRSALPHP